MSVETKAVECEFGCDDPIHASDEVRQQWRDALSGKIELMRHRNAAS